MRGDVDVALGGARRSPVEVERRAAGVGFGLAKYAVESCGVGEPVGEFSTDDVSVL